MSQLLLELLDMNFPGIIHSIYRQNKQFTLLRIDTFIVNWNAVNYLSVL